MFLIPWEVIPGDPSSPVAGKVSKRKANSERRTGFHSGSSCQPRVGWYNGPAAHALLTSVLRSGT